ncbi:MAG: hypothetical protein BMS9Abin08_0928 [Gammaproteobacteria bacterium]|nr:MAG: hypothetical protein BMS9Abin08_0928 [Gammaproteobacteria bacterium]
MLSPLRARFILVFMAMLCASGRVAAQAPGKDENLVNYSYATVFGTGVYQVKDQTAFILRLPFSYSLREPSAERPGMNLLLPAMVGYYDYDDVLDGSLPADAATLSFVPGLEFEYTMNARWRLKPYAQAGLGRDLKNRENALIYVGGFKSRYSLPYEGKWRFALGNTAVYTGYDPDDGPLQSTAILGIGMDMVYPWGLSLFGKETSLANYLIYYWYLDNPSFEQGNDRAERVTGEIEWGLALGFEKPPKFLGYEFNRIGLGLRYGDDIKGVRLVTDFPF